MTKIDKKVLKCQHLLQKHFDDNSEKDISKYFEINSLFNVQVQNKMSVRNGTKLEDKSLIKQEQK